MNTETLQVGDRIVFTCDNYMQISRNGTWLRFNGVESVHSSFVHARQIANGIAWTHGLQVSEGDQEKTRVVFILTQ